MAREIRIGVIGCGFFSPNHLHAWRDLADQGARLAAVCDIDPDKAAAAGQTFDVPYYTDAAKMFDEARIDLVDIVTRHDSHRALSALAVQRGIPVVVQKPLATTWEDCVAIVENARSAGVWLAVHENFRFQAPIRRVRETIDSGEIGTPTWARIRFRTGFDVYANQPYFYDEERLAIADVGVHMLDVTRFLVGEVERLSCETQRRNPKPRAEDTATILLRHEGGAVSVVECTYGARRLPDPFPETLLEIEGPQGSILLDPGCQMTVTSGDARRTEDVGAPLLSWTAHPWHVAQQGTFAACCHFLDRLQRGLPAETSGEDSLRTYALVEAAYRAATEGRAVKPSDWLTGLRDEA